MAFKTKGKMRIWSKEHRTAVLCFSQSLPPSSFLPSFSPPSQTRTPSSLIAQLEVVLLQTPFKLPSQGTLTALTRFGFLLQLCFIFISFTRPSDKSPTWKLLDFLISLPGNVNSFPKPCSSPSILSSLHVFIGQGLSSPKPSLASQSKWGSDITPDLGSPRKRKPNQMSIIKKYVFHTYLHMMVENELYILCI